MVGESCVHTIESAMGAQQGDVKGPFLFAKGIHQHFVEGLTGILRPHQGSFVQFIIDDGNFLLPDEAVLEVLFITMEHGPPLSIHLNTGKTELLMGKHGSYDAAYSFFEVPIGSSRKGFDSIPMITPAAFTAPGTWHSRQS